IVGLVVIAISGPPGVSRAPSRSAPFDYAGAQRSITPQATRGPEFPAGSVLSSSGSAWMISEVPPGWKSEFGPSFSVTSESTVSREPGSIGSHPEREAHAAGDLAER